MLSDQVLADSASFDTLSQVLDAAAGDTPSLADAPDYRALAEAMIAQGSVVQVQFISPAVLLPDPAAPQTPEDWGSLPPYTVLGIADLSTGDEQIALIAIPYADSATALEAGTVISARLQSYQSVVADSAYMDLLTARGATLAAPDVYASETNGQALALIALHYPLATGSAASSQVFRLLMNSIYQRDAAFLASDA
jgi:hypothetical protein